MVVKCKVDQIPVHKENSCDRCKEDEPEPQEDVNLSEREVNKKAPSYFTEMFCKIRSYFTEPFQTLQQIHGKKG